MYFCVIVSRYGEAQRLIPVTDGAQCDYLSTWPDEELARDAIKYMEIKPGQEILLVSTNDCITTPWPQ